MSEARLHALHWAFFVDVMNMKFEDVYAMFSAWCESVPADEMADIMALGDELFGDDDTDDEQPALQCYLPARRAARQPIYRR